MFLLTELTGQIGHCKVIENLMFEVLAVWEHFRLKKLLLQCKKMPQNINGFLNLKTALEMYN